MIWAFIITIVLLGLFLSGLFSGCETGIYCVNRLRIELGLRSADAGAARLQHLLADEQSAVSVALIGTNVANYIITTAVAFLFSSLLDRSDAQAELYTVAIVTPVVFVFGEVVPKNLFQLHADYLMRLVSVPLTITARMCRAVGIVHLLKMFVSAANRLAGSIESDTITTPRHRVASLLQDALADRVLGEEQSELVDRVVQLSETAVHAVMVPRNRVTSIHIKANRKDLLRIAGRTVHARLPVYDTARTHVMGIIKIDDLLQRHDWKTVGECMRDVPTVRPHITVARAIRTLQEMHRSIAVVTDNTGRMLGIVTLTDLLEELVG